jgi:hypothetical protein
MLFLYEEGKIPQSVVTRKIAKPGRFNLFALNIAVAHIFPVIPFQPDDSV